MSPCFMQNITLNGENRFKLIATLTKFSMDLTILENLNAWKIHVSKSTLALSAESHNIAVEEHYKKLKWYFQEAPDNVEFKFDKGKFTLNLLFDNDLKVVYFKTILKKASFSKCALDWIDQLYSEKNRNFQMLCEEQKKCLHLEYITKEYESKLNKLAERKQKEETELYNKFLTILNEKKMQIQHLNDLLVAFRQGRSITNERYLNTSKAIKKRRKKNIEKEKSPSQNNSESESLSDAYNTDENSNSKIFLKESKRPVSPKPCTSKQNLNFLTEDEPDIVLPELIRSDSAKETKFHSKELKKIVKRDMKTDNIKDNVNLSTQDLLNGL